MNTRNSILLSSNDVGASGTKIIDLNFPDVISRITVIFSAKTLATPTPAEVAAANITKLEIVDGSNVIFSLTGMQTHALDFFDTGRHYICGGSYVPGWGLVAYLTINFGRFLFDPALGFDPKKFTNPQLKITHDEDIAVADCVENSLSVYCDMFDEKAVTPTGFLMNKEIFSYTPVADATEEVDLPNDFPFRKLIVQARVPDLWFGGIMNSIKLSEDNDKRIPFDLSGGALEHWLGEMHGAYHDGIIVDLDTATGVDCYHAPTQGCKLRGDFYCDSDVIDNLPFGYRNKYLTTTMTGYTVMDIAGTMPHGCMCFDMGRQDVIEDWYQVAGKALKLKIKAGDSIGATEEFNVICQQYRSY